MYFQESSFFSVSGVQKRTFLAHFRILCQTCQVYFPELKKNWAQNRPKWPSGPFFPESSRKNIFVEWIPTTFLVTISVSEKIPSSKRKEWATLGVAQKAAHFWKPCNFIQNGKSASDMLLGIPWGKKGKWASLA